MPNMIRSRCLKLLLLAAVVFSQAWHSALGQSCTCNTVANKQVMLRLYAATSGSQWTSPRDTSKNICTWAGVDRCNAEFIEKIDLRGRNMRGDITGFSFASLTSLTQLDMSNNADLEGSIDTIGLPASLSTLSLSATSVSGTIPDVLWSAGLPNLILLDCTSCRLRGTLPNAWCASSAPRLRGLTLAGNRLLSGTLPASMALCPLTTIDLSLGNLTGTIPGAWGAGATFASSLNELHLADNDLTGTIPAAWFEWEGVLALNVSWNRFTGGLPSTISIPFVTMVDVSHNGLNGSLPSTIPNTVQTFCASNNNFTGRLPPQLPKSLLRFDVSHNQLSGSLRAGWLALSLTALDMSANRLTGTLPSSWGNLTSSPMTTLDLSSNALSGALPMTWGNVCADLNLSFNALVLPLPAWEKATSVGVLDMRFNDLSGVVSVIPSPLSLHTICLNHNAITSVAAPLASMLALKNIAAANNRIVAFPTSLPRNLATLDLRSNALTGTLPHAYAAYGALTDVLLSNNNITGGLPGVWRWIYALQFVELTNNRQMQLLRVPPAWCPPLRAKTWVVELSGTAITFPNGSVDATSTPASVADWVAQWCPTWTASEVATDTPARLSPSSTVSARWSDTKFVTKLWLTATRTRPSRTWNASTPTQNASASFNVSSSTSCSAFQGSRSTSFSAAADTDSHPVSSSPSRLASMSLAVTPTRLRGASRSATATVGGSMSESPSLTGSESGVVTASRERLSMTANSTSMTATLKCDTTTNVSNVDGLSVGLYDIYTASTHSIVVSWSRPVAAVHTSTSWGSISLVVPPGMEPTPTWTTTSTNRTELLLRAPSVMNSFAEAITARITIAVTWSQYSGSIVCFHTAAFDVRLGASDPPTPEAVRTVATVTAVAAVGPLSGAAAAAVQQSMLQLSLSQCVFSDTAQLPISDNPTRLMIGDAVGAAYRGAAVGNMMLIVVVVVLATIAAACHHMVTGTPTLLHSLAFLRMPGRSIIVVAMLLQPMVSSATALLSLPGGSGGADVALALVTLGFLVLTVARFLLRTLQVVRDLRVVYQQPSDWLDFLVGRRLRWVPRSVPEHNLRVAAGSLAELTRQPSEDLAQSLATEPSVDAEDDTTVTSAILCAQRYDLILGRQVPGREWFFGVEMAAAAIYGVIGGLRPQTPDGCRRSQIVLCCASGAYALLVLGLRPFAASTDLVFHIFIACLSFASGVMMVAAYPAASDIVSFVQIGCLLLRGVLHVANVLRVSGLTSTRKEEVRSAAACTDNEAPRDVSRLDALPMDHSDVIDSDIDVEEMLWFVPPPLPPLLPHEEERQAAVPPRSLPSTPTQFSTNDVLLAICEDLEMLRRGQRQQRRDDSGDEVDAEDAVQSISDTLCPYLPSSLVERRTRLKNAIQMIATMNAHP